MKRSRALFKMQSIRKRRRDLRDKLARLPHLLALLCCWRWVQQVNEAGALYLTQQQQQQAPQVPELINNGAIIQALGQALGSGVQSGSVLVGPGGALQAPSGSQQASGAAGSNQTAALSAGQVAAASSSNSASSNQFVIKFIHNDAKNQMAYVSITPVNYTNLHQPRIDLRYQSPTRGYVNLPESSPNNTVVAAVVVEDEDTGLNGETSLSIESGNELNHFKLVSTTFTNTIQVNAPLSRQRTPEYNLTIVARDHGSPPKSSSSTLIIRLQASPHSFGSLLHSPLEPQQSLKAPATDLMYVGTMLVLVFVIVVTLIIIFGCVLVQRPQRIGGKHGHKSQPATRTTSASNSRIIPPSDQCSAHYCMSAGYNLTNL